MMENKINKEYWEKNIEGFSGFYDTQSEETINAPGWFSPLYKKFIFPVEKKYMRQRYDFVCDYIDTNVKKGMKVADIGCGSGVYTKRMIEKGAFVYALDYAQSAVGLTKKNLNNIEANSSEVLLFDVTRQKIPDVDLAISIGVLPYISGIETFFSNTLPHTGEFLFNYLSADNFLNRMRKKIKMLDVRNYSYHNFNEIHRNLSLYNFNINRKEKLATGFLVETKKIINWYYKNAL